MGYHTYTRLLALCSGCGMEPVWGKDYMIDSLYCPSCGKTTAHYFDGDMYAAEEWDRLNKSKPRWAVYNEKDERVAVIGPDEKKARQYA